MAEEGDPVNATTKSNLKKVADLAPDQITVERFVTDLPAIFDQILSLDPKMPAGSLRARKSAASAVARWAYQERIVTISPDLAERLGMPPQFVFADWTEAPKALTAYKALLAEMSLLGASKEELDERFLAKFLERLPDHMKDWRGGWREFVNRWRTLAEDGELPDIDLPVLLTKKPDTYRIAIHDLPGHLRQQLEGVRERLLGSVLQDRLSIPMDESTVDLQIGTVLRLLGFLKREQGLDLQKVNLTNALALENAKALIAYTNARWCERNDFAGDEKDPGIGSYEYGQLLQLAAVVRDGLRAEALAAEYAEECRFAKKLIQQRREALKSIGSVNDYLGVSCDLVVRSREVPSHQIITRATLLRDALIFALQSVFADRLSVLTSLTFGEHIREGEDGAVLICIPKEETKPGLRDLVRELPAELYGLWRENIDWARPILLSGNPDHGRLWVAQGGGELTSGAIYALFETRCLEQLGVRHNPHQTRKALSTDFYGWSGGDSLTLSAVIDSHPQTLERYYIQQKHEHATGEFDEATADSWESQDGGAVA
jgi:hypothetical protein